MSEPTCVICTKPLPDNAYACTDETRKAAGRLRAITEMLGAARDVAQRQSAQDGGGSGRPGSSLPLELSATSRLDAVQNELVGIVRDIAETRGLAVPLVAPKPGPACREECGHPSCGEVRAREPLDVIMAACEWLPDHLEWVRHRQQADDTLRAIGACERIVRGIVREPGSKVFLGPCLAPAGEPEADCPVNCECHNGPYYACSEPGGCGSAGCGRPPGECQGDVYGFRDGEIGTCRTCGARVAQAERLAWLDEQVRERAFRAYEIADAYRISVDTIRSWASRGKLRSYWRTDAGLTVEWVDPVLDPKLEGEELKKRLGEISDEVQARGGRLHYVGDVLDLAAKDAARRETERATRERRAAARAAESEEAA